VGFAELVNHVTEIHAGLKYESVSPRFGNIMGEFSKITIRTKQNLLACGVNRLPEFGIAGNDHLPVNVRKHECSACPNKIVMLDHYLNTCLCPRFHVEECTPEETVKNFLHFVRFGSSHEQHVPPE